MERIHPGNECYVLLIKATLALKIFIDQARIGHPLPYQKPSTVAETIDDFNQLKATPLKEPLKRRRGFTAGQKACDFFMEEERMQCAKSTRGAMSTFIKSPLLIVAIIGYIHTESAHNSFIKTLFSDLIPSDFNALYVKELISVLSKDLLITSFFNPTGGWSGRLFGALASNEIMFYMETDPNTNLHNKKMTITQTYNAHETKIISGSSSQANTVQSGEKTYIFNQFPIEDLPESLLRAQGKGFNLVFYSPPYGDLEAYPDDGSNTQSRIRYTTTDEWLKGFLYPSIEKSYIALSSNGIFAINIAKAKGVDLPYYVRQYMNCPEVARQFIFRCEYNYSLGTTYPSPVYVYQKFENITLSIFKKLTPLAPLTLKKRILRMAEAEKETREREREEKEEKEKEKKDAQKMLQILTMFHEANSHQVTSKPQEATYTLIPRADTMPPLRVLPHATPAA